jgi:hypothetical protein
MFPPGHTIRRALASRTTTPATVTNHLVRCSRSVIIPPYVVFRASLLGRRTYLNARYSISEIHAMTIGTEWLPRNTIDLSGVRFHDKHMQAVFYLACKDYVAYQQDLRGRNDPILKYEHHQPKTIDTPTAPRCVYILPLTAKLGARGFKPSGIICLRLQKPKRSVTVTLVGEMPAPVCCGSTRPASFFRSLPLLSVASHTPPLQNSTTEELLHSQEPTPSQFVET